jgi:hypothetical protein
MLKKFRLSRSIDRLQEEKLYEAVAIELTAENINTGIWAKAQAFSDGCDNRARSLYIKYRVQSIIDSGRVREFIPELEKTTTHHLVDSSTPDKKQNKTKYSDANVNDELEVNSFKTDKSTKKHLSSEDITITEDGGYKCGSYVFNTLEYAKNYSLKLSQNRLLTAQTSSEPKNIETSSNQVQKSNDFYEKYMPVEDFADLKNITIEKAISMIRAGFYDGQVKNEKWYVSSSEIAEVGDNKRSEIAEVDDNKSSGLKLMDGDYGLAKTYWLFGVIGNLLFLIPSVYANNTESEGLWVITNIGNSVYLLIVIIGMWRASNKYLGPQIWAILAKLFSIFGVVKIIGNLALLVAVFK